jgi:hypothetical protein
MNKYKVSIKHPDFGCSGEEVTAKNMLQALVLIDKEFPGSEVLKAEYVYPESACICRGFFRPRHCPVHGWDFTVHIRGSDEVL